MRFREIFRYEFAYQARRVSNWLFAFVLVDISFLLTKENFLADAMLDDFYINSPFVVAMVTVFATMLWVLIGGSTAGEATARDVESLMHPLVYTQPVTKLEYLGGRFLAVLAINLLIINAAPLGVIMATFWPGVDPEVIGPFRFAAFARPWLFIALPNVFSVTALQFAFSTIGRRATLAYVASVAVFFSTYILSGIFIGAIGKPEIAHFTDAIGIITVVSDIANNWTPIEKSHRLLELNGSFLLNRITWVSIGFAALLITYIRFRFEHVTVSRNVIAQLAPHWLRGLFRAIPRFEVPDYPHPRVTTASENITPTFDLRSRLRQVLLITSTSYRKITFGGLGIWLWLLSGLFAFIFIPENMELDSIPQLAKPELVVNFLTGPLNKLASPWIIIPLFLLIYTGELVWREREAGLGELTDSKPVPEWIFFLGRFFALALIAITWLSILMVAGLLIQLRMGYPLFDIPFYLKAFYGFQLTEYLLFIVLAITVHVFVNHKYIAHLVVLVAYAFILLGFMLGLEHKMLMYGVSPPWSYTEMRSFGTSAGPWIWFKFYWASWALLLAVIARLFWVRSKDNNFRVRWVVAKGRFKGGTVLIAAAAIMLVVIIGGYVFYNTNILHEYRSEAGYAKRLAQYEHLYGRYRNTPQPIINTFSLKIDIHPKTRTADVRGQYELVNMTDFVIDTIHVENAAGVETTSLKLDQSSIISEDRELRHNIYKLTKPLQPGDIIHLDFQLHYETHGFTVIGTSSDVLANGTKFTNEWFPVIGYQAMRELYSPGDRRKNGLKPRPIVPSLYDSTARGTKGDSQPINVETEITTDEGQTAIAPGVLQETSTKDGRTYFKYSTTAPISNSFGIFSAKYEINESTWTDSTTGRKVVVQVFHSPGHDNNVARMMKSARASLDFYSERYGEYRYPILKFIEYPGHGAGMHAEPMEITFQEGFSAWDPDNDPENLDLIFGIVGHEVAHQFQAPLAFAEGAPILSESFAWYCSMGVVERTYGHDHLRKLLRFMREPYPYQPIKLGVPLLRGLDPYLSYRKGPFALYALTEYIGRKNVDSAMHVFLDKFRSGESPRATTLDLYAELKKVTPDSVQYLLHDLFEKNTFWELETEKATVSRLDSTTWQVTMDVKARKIEVDSAGVETEIPMKSEWLEVGVFENRALSRPPILITKRQIDSGDQTISIEVKSAIKPERVAIDPYHVLIDLDTDNNYKRIRDEK
ncbi:MAG: ABC transporter permease subunit [Bacteroidota bacterium]